MYNKLFSKILDSSIWLESDATRLCWLTCLAVMDEDGFVQFASVANLAHRARIPIDAAQEAVRRLEGPDVDSSDPDNEGSRLERVPGGWMVLNSAKYRSIATGDIARKQTRERVRRHRANNPRPRQNPGVAVTPCNARVTVGNDLVTPSETETETETHVRTAPSIAGAPPSGDGSPMAKDVITLWNSIVTPPIPKAQKLTGDRRARLRARVKPYPDLETWRTVIAWVNGQSWCRAPGTGSHPNWTATIDWLIRSDEPIQKALEQADTPVEDRFHRGPKLGFGPLGDRCSHHPVCWDEAECTAKNRGATA